MKRIVVFDISSKYEEVDTFNGIMCDTVNEWINKNEKYYEIKDISVFAWEHLKSIEVCHAKVLITYEIKQGG